MKKFADKILMKNNLWLFVIVFAVVPQISSAYVGPGLAISTILLIIGVLGSLLLAILAIIYYPIKRLIKKSRSQKKIKNK